VPSSVSVRDRAKTKAESARPKQGQGSSVETEARQGRDALRQRQGRGSEKNCVEAASRQGTASRTTSLLGKSLINQSAVSRHDLPLAFALLLLGQAADMWAGSRHVSKHNIMEMKVDCCCDRKQIQYQQSIEFLHSQHQELIGNLHEEIERLKRKNRGLIFYRTL